MLTVAIFTTTRAEFGILTPLIHQIGKTPEIEYMLFAGGSHLAYEHGKTINEIKQAKVNITDNFDFLMNGDDAFALSKGCGIAINEVAHIFNTHAFDFVILLGDRYELLTIASVAILFKKPIIHIHGGELTYGAIDEQVRHMITKAAHLHFVTCNDYYNNVRYMGEQEWRIVNTGALAVENMIANSNMEKTQPFKDVGLDQNKPVAIMTYHPTTREINVKPEIQIENIFKSLEDYPGQLVITAPNMDEERDVMVKAIMNAVKKNENYTYIESLGMQRYLSLVKHCDFVIGNSSSGILEVPFFKIPTINIGSRQDGRLRHKSIIDTGYDEMSIKKAIEKALKIDFRKELQTMEYKFGDGTASKKMVDAMLTLGKRKDLMNKKLDFPW
jgi:GDP/UDP-N,N'-diacetylbacillosamine 2-epimerase (hydrolysing)